MANYNNKLYYNKHANENGLTYNSMGYQIIFHVREVLNSSDNVSDYITYAILYERAKVGDAMLLSALYKNTDIFIFESADLKSTSLFNVIECLNLKETFENVIVALYVTDKTKALDEFSDLFALIPTRETGELDEWLDIDTLINVAESNGFDEAYSILAEISKYDNIGMTDRDIAQAVSDFIIGRSREIGEPELSDAFDWISPFDLMIDWNATKIQIMPESSLTTIEMNGVDGSIVQDTVYKDRMFDIVAWSEQGLTIPQKEDLKRRITEILDATKEHTKKLTIKKRDVSYDVKYDGQLGVEEAPSFLKFQIPLRASAYGYDQFENKLRGNGLIYNRGISDVGVINFIGSGCVNPKFEMGSEKYAYNGTVPDGCKLVVNHANMTVYIEDNFGVKTNARADFTGKFQTVPKNTSIALTADENTVDYITTTWYNRYLY